MRWTPCALDPLSFLVRVVLAVGAEVVRTVAIQLVSFSEHRFRETLALRRTRHTLALSLWLPHAELLCDEAVLNHLVYVLFLSKWSLIIKVHIAHLLADIWLVYALWVMPYEAMIDQTLPNKVSIYAVSMRGCRSLLVTTRLDLVFAEKYALAVDLLKCYIRRRKIIIVNRVLIECVHRRVGARATLVESLLRHYALTSLLLAVLQVLSVVCAYLKVGGNHAVGTLTVVLVAKRVTFA